LAWILLRKGPKTQTGENKMENYFMINKRTGAGARAAVEIFSCAGIDAYHKGTKVYHKPCDISIIERAYLVTEQWMARKPGEHPNAWVSFDSATGTKMQVVVSYITSYGRYYASVDADRKLARLIARRILQALDETKPCKKGKK